MARIANPLIRGFESHPVLHFNVSLAQLAEFRSPKPAVRGSNPWRYAKIKYYGRVSRIGIAAAVLKTEGSEMGV